MLRLALDRNAVNAKDYGYNINFQITDENHVNKNLTGYTLKFKAFPPINPGSYKVYAPAAVDSASTGTGHYVVAKSDFDSAWAYYKVSVELTSATEISTTQPVDFEVLPSPQTAY